MSRSGKRGVKAVLAVVLLGSFGLALLLWQTTEGRRRYGTLPPLLPKTKAAALLLTGAKQQVGTKYNATYRVISYPGGDVPSTTGACTDVIVRAGRMAGYDLQKLIHEDMVRNFKAYPQKWGLPAPDSNIDHRRVPNQMRFFERKGLRLTKSVNSKTLATWQVGDFVYWDTGRNLHTGVISDRRNQYGEPFVIHNGWMCVEEDVLTKWRIIGHYRYPARSEPRSKPATQA
jgi:uncharacterized protein YijF (DUF1287 family)